MELKPQVYELISLCYKEGFNTNVIKQLEHLVLDSYVKLFFSQFYKVYTLGVRDLRQVL